MSCGVRVRNIPKEVKDKNLKVHFSKPENGGGRITKIYYPLCNNDAVILFEDRKVVDSILKRDQCFGTCQLDIERLPEHMMSGSLDEEASVLLQAYQSLQDDMVFGEGIKLSETVNGKYAIQGDWFQMEWAWHYIDCFMQQQEVIQYTSSQQPQHYASTPQEVDQFEQSADPSRPSPRQRSPSDVSSRLQQSVAQHEGSKHSHSSRRKDQTSRSYRETSPEPHGGFDDDRRVDPRQYNNKHQYGRSGSNRHVHDDERPEMRESHRSYGSYEHSSPAGRQQHDDIDDGLGFHGQRFEVPMNIKRSMSYPGTNARRTDENNTFREFSDQTSQYSDRNVPDQDKKIHPEDMTAAMESLTVRDTAQDPGANDQHHQYADDKYHQYADDKHHQYADDKHRQYTDDQFQHADDAFNSSHSSTHSTLSHCGSASLRQTASRTSPPSADVGASMPGSTTPTVTPSIPKPKAMPTRYTEDQLFQTFGINGVQVTIYFGDLLIEETEVIVNAANESLEHYGGIAGALLRARGSEMNTECRRYITKHGKLRTTDVMHTSGGGKIKADYIVHAAGPMWISSGAGNKDWFIKQLTLTFQNCLNHADDVLFVKSIAMPVISSGVYGAPLDVCVRCFLKAILLFTNDRTDRTLQDIRLVNNDAESTVTSIVLVQTLLDAGIPALTKEAEEAMKKEDSSYLGMNLPKGRRDTDSKTMQYRTSTDMLKGSLGGKSFLQTAPDLGLRASQRQSSSASHTVRRASPDTSDTDRYGESSRSCTGTGHSMGHSVSHVSGGLSDRLHRSRTDDETSPKKQSMNLSRTYTAGLKSPSKSAGFSGASARDEVLDLDKMRQQLLTGDRDNMRPKSSKRQTTSALMGHAGDDDGGYTKQRPSYSMHDTSIDSTDSEAGIRTLPADIKPQSSRGQFLGASAAPEDKLDICAICLNQVQQSKELKCKHKFCTPCIQTHFKKSKPSCPTCGMLFGKVVGDQPESGRMTYVVDRKRCLSGYEHEDGMIIITYTFQEGIQQSHHPNPGKRYKGIKRVAYLPNTSEGLEILRLLRKAFELKLVFTIGDSVTTGQSGVITWNDIHHKTNMTGGSSKFGYPDPTYLQRVKQELADKGITSTR